MNPAVRAAVEVGRQCRIVSTGPELIQETNHTVIWLRPHAVIAKVGRRIDADENLLREFEVAAELSSQSAPVVRPLPGSAPTRHCETGYIVDLWQRLERDPDAEPSEFEIGSSLKSVHTGLKRCTALLPDFTVAIEKARDAVFDDVHTGLMERVDLDFLRRCFGQLITRLDDHEFQKQPLHGEPHAGNYIATRDGIRWLDFENACLGPLEWDLAYLSDRSRKAFSGIDDVLLRLLRSLASACVATWCGGSRFAEMRVYGEEHLNQLRASMGDG